MKRELGYRGEVSMNVDFESIKRYQEKQLEKMKAERIAEQGFVKKQGLRPFRGKSVNKF